MRAKKLAYLSVSVALAMILSYIESQIPSLTAIPGVKAGLANIAVVFVLYRFGTKEAVIVSVIRVFLVSVMFGSVLSLAYSLSGAVLSLFIMIVLKKFRVFSTTAVSISGGVMHNVGQILAAMFLIRTDVLKYYLPFLIISGIVSGIVIGLVSSLLINRIKLEDI